MMSFDPKPYEEHFKKNKSKWFMTPEDLGREFSEPNGQKWKILGSVKGERKCQILVQEVGGERIVKMMWQDVLHCMDRWPPKFSNFTVTYGVDEPPKCGNDGLSECSG